MVKQVEGWKLIIVRSFPKAKVKCMKGYVKPCIRENDADHVILHVGTSKQKLNRERIAR